MLVKFELSTKERRRKSWLLAVNGGDERIFFCSPSCGVSVEEVIVVECIAHFFAR